MLPGLPRIVLNVTPFRAVSWAQHGDVGEAYLFALSVDGHTGHNDPILALFGGQTLTRG